MKISNATKQKLRVPDFIKLFKFTKKVSRFIGKEKAFSILEQFVIENRLNWIKQNYKIIKKRKGTINDAMEIFYRLNQGLDFKDAKVVKKTDKILITRWHNFCPVLEACKALKLDTREICKKIYDRPNQIFLSRVNPRLAFRRNYKQVRPYSDYCEEIIEYKE